MCYMTIKTPGYKIGSTLKISINIFYIQDLFYYVVQMFFIHYIKLILS